MRLPCRHWILFVLGAVVAAAQNARPEKKHKSSQHTVAALSAGIGYQPVPTEPATAPAEPVETDSPRNEIIRLPRYVVRDRPPVFTERDLYSKANLRKLAAGRYLNPIQQKIFSPFRIGNLDEEYALLCYEADERKHNMAELDNVVELYRLEGDKAGADALETDVQKTFMRRTSFGPKSNATK